MNNISSPKEIQTLLERERARTDRNGREFCIVIFDLHNSTDKSSYAATLLNVLNKRVRCYDEIGWFDEHHICVILPDTPREGAHKLVQKVSIEAPATNSHKIFSYPFHWINGKKKENRDLKADPEPQDVYKQPLKGCGRPAQELEVFLPTGMPLWKRGLDVICALLALVILFPLLLLIGIFIKIVSRGPALFKQQRIGYLGETFDCWKFRTMKLNTDQEVHKQHLSELIHNNNTMVKLDEQDARIIPCGNFFRTTGLDELPQLINVISGQMSLIGPRPCIPYEAQEYLAWQHKRFEAVPGLSGLWQVSGKNRTTFNEMMRLDIAYAKKKSFWLDLKILIKTMPAIFGQVTEDKKRIKNGRI